MSEAKAAVQPEVIEFPQTPEQLEYFIAGTLNKINSNPDNVNVHAEYLLRHLLGLTVEQRARRERQALRPVVVSTYYRGSLKAVVGIDTTGEFKVDFFQEALDAEGKVIFSDNVVEGVSVKKATWKPAELNQGPLEGLTKTVLSQAVQPNQVFYVTTEVGIEAHMEAMTDFIMSQRDSVNELADKSNDQLLQEATAAATGTQH